jgi:flagellar hook-length control protein FliK
MAAGASGIVSAALPLREQAPLDTGERKSDKAGGRLPSARAARSMDAPVTVAAARLVVVDLRGAEARVSASGAPSVQGRRAPKRSSAAEGARSKGETSPQTAGGTAVLAVRPREQQAPLVSVRGVADTDGPLTQPNQRPAAEVSPPTGRFSEMLRDEVVRQTTFLVRDGGQGEIRLVLKPESLGEVRIRVRLGEDAIEGRILVRTPEAREIFRENLPTLEAALRAQGFETARLDVAVSDGGGRERPQSETPLPAAAPVRAGEVHEQNGRIVLLSDGGQHAVYLTA